jgi:hypothetical protein
MAHVKVDKIVGKTQKVKAKIDILVGGVAIKAGDTCDVPAHEAKFLIGIDRVEVAADEEVSEKKK